MKDKSEEEMIVKGHATENQTKKKKSSIHRTCLFAWSHSLRDVKSCNEVREFKLQKKKRWLFRLKNKSELAARTPPSLVKMPFFI